MGELATKKEVLGHVFKQYDSACRSELSAIQVQILHGDLRMGGISLPQVLASMKYTCATDHCQESELFDLLQEMDRRYYLIQDFRWEFSLLDTSQTDTISTPQAKWMVQAVHGKHFSHKKWQNFLDNRPVAGTGIAFAEIEVMLCDIPSKLDLRSEEDEKRKIVEEQEQKKKLIEKEARRLRKERDDEKRKEEEERKKLEEEKRKRLLEDEENRRKTEEVRLQKEEQEEQRRLKELEEKQREEEEKRKKEEEELYKNVEELAKKEAKEEKETEEEIKKRKKDDPELEKLKKEKMDHKHKKLRYQLKVAIKSRDKYQLEFSMTEFKKEKVEDKDMDLIKAEKLLKELNTKDNLKKAMTKREIEEIEKAIETVRKYGFEVQLAKEVSEANQLLARLRRLERIRHEILELKQSTVAEIRSYQSPPAVVHTVMTVTFLLLGHKEKETQNWKSVQALVGKTGKESLKRRCLESKPENIAVPVAKRAKVLLEKFELDEVRDVSAGAATFYVWDAVSVDEIFYQQVFVIHFSRTQLREVTHPSLRFRKMSKCVKLVLQSMTMVEEVLLSLEVKEDN